MQCRADLVFSALLAVAWVLAAFAVHAEPRKRISGPHTFQNLTVYFVHGPSETGPVPLTLSEALKAKTVEVLETGNIRSLSIENHGEISVFVQRGEIVKGGKQDRVLTVSLLVPPRSGRMPIGAYCVEKGRWSRRGREDVRRFATASALVSSRCAKIPMFATGSAPHVCAPVPPGELRRRIARPAQQLAAAPKAPSKQKAIWDSVAETQRQLSNALDAQIAASKSATSLQLSLENKKLNAKTDMFVAALGSAIDDKDDIVGFVYAVNGKIDSGDIYPSNALFRKMWPKLLKAAATEAIGAQAKGETADSAPTPLKVAEIETFLKTASTGKKLDRQVSKDLEIETRSTDEVILSTTRSIAGGLLHQSLIAR